MKNTILGFITIVALSSSYSGMAASISSVSITGAPANPTIVVSGSGFGSQPAPTFLGFPGYTGYDYGNAIYITDSSPSHGFEAGADAGQNLRDLIGLVIQSYSDTQVQFQLGSDYSLYYFPNNIYALDPGDPFTVVINGASFSGVVGAAPTPEPASLVTLLTGLASAGLFARRHINSVAS